MINFKCDKRFRQALKRLADQQAISVSALIKQVLATHLQKYGIDWQKEVVLDDEAE